MSAIRVCVAPPADNKGKNVLRAHINVTNTPPHIRLAGFRGDQILPRGFMTSRLPFPSAFFTVWLVAVPIERTTMWNIIIGLVMIIGGASGKLALRGTNSTAALIAIGVALLGWGVFQVVRSRNNA